MTSDSCARLTPGSDAMALPMLKKAAAHAAAINRFI
jgi:hypothetical protein